MSLAREHEANKISTRLYHPTFPYCGFPCQAHPYKLYAPHPITRTPWLIGLLAWDCLTPV